MTLDAETEDRWQTFILERFVHTLDEIVGLSGGVTWPGEQWFCHPQFSINDALRLGALLRSLIQESAHLYGQTNTVLASRGQRLTPSFRARELRYPTALVNPTGDEGVMMNDELEDVRGDVPVLMAALPGGVDLNLSRWLTHRVGILGNHFVTTGDLISLAANLHGGVHLKRPTTEAELVLFRWSVRMIELIDTETETYFGPAYGLRAIGRITMRGLYPHYLAAQKIVQSKAARYGSVDTAG